MSTAEFAAYFPFDKPGRQATAGRWRSMARLWLHTGVVQGVGSQFAARAYEPANQRFLVGPGAAWVNGFYGESGNDYWVQTPGNDGFVKVRLEPNAQQVQLFYEQGHFWHQDPWAAHGVVEAPLYEIWPDGRFDDRRQMVSPDVVQGLETIPDWVPRGHAIEARGPASTVDVGPGGNAVALWLSWIPGFVPGRSYRVSGSARPTRGAGWNNAWVFLQAISGDGVVQESRLAYPLTGSPAQGSTIGASEFVLASSGDLLVSVQVVGGFGAVNFEAGSCYIEVADLGVQ